MKFNLPRIWVPKKFGVVSFTPIDPVAMLKRMIRANMNAMGLGARTALANAGEGWHLNGLWTGFAADAPYTTRYLMVQFAPSGTAQPANIPYTLPAWSLFQQYPIANGGIPLGICADEPGSGLSGTLDINPIPSNINLLGSASKSLIGITDSVVSYGSVLVPSATTAGYLRSSAGLPAGLYQTPGIAISTSEGNGAQIEFDPRPGFIGIDILT
jgi:hypothetical protein